MSIEAMKLALDSNFLRLKIKEPKDPTLAVEYIIENAGNFAAAKADRVYLDEFRKSKKALLMSQSTAKTAVEREQYAYSHNEYLELLQGLRSAVEVEEKLKFMLIAAQLKVDIWRTAQASNRNQDRATR